MRYNVVLGCLLVWSVLTISAEAGGSERDRELYRELHRGLQSRISVPPEPTIEMRACYERLGKIGSFVAISAQHDAVSCPVTDLVRFWPDRFFVPDALRD